jgi:hypothetical protein
MPRRSEHLTSARNTIQNTAVPDVLMVESVQTATRRLRRRRRRPELLAVFLREQPLPFPAVADPGRVAYRAFGLARTSWATMLRPGVILRYLRLIFRGWRLQLVREGEDILQLGGDFVLDQDGRLTYAYRSGELGPQLCGSTALIRKPVPIRESPA